MTLLLKLTGYLFAGMTLGVLVLLGTGTWIELVVWN